MRQTARHARRPSRLRELEGRVPRGKTAPAEEGEEAHECSAPEGHCGGRRDSTRRPGAEDEAVDGRLVGVRRLLEEAGNQPAVLVSSALAQAARASLIEELIKGATKARG